MKKAVYEEQQRYETAALVNMLSKSSELLSIGLGQAGQHILKNHLENDKINLLEKGNKVYCIFGFCNIRDFAAINSLLSEKVLTFVNRIAEIVHNSVHQHLGVTNKNIGDVFFLVWKFKNSELIYKNSKDELVKLLNDSSDEEEGENRINTMINDDIWVPVLNPSDQIAKKKCDLALISFVKIFLSIKTDAALKKYLLQNLNRSKIDMGFGLHCGWAIEGAIGSEHKIDASYLSPMVNLSSRFQAATKQFEVFINISQFLYSYLTKRMKSFMRLIDKVTVKGSSIPIKIFCFDLNVAAIEGKDKTPRHSIKKRNKTLSDQKLLQETKQFKSSADFQKRIQGILVKINKQQKIKNTLKDLRSKNPKFYREFLNNPNLKEATRCFTPEFKRKWKEGYSYYISGEWIKAYEIFRETKNMLNDWEYTDGPSKVLMSYMKNRDLKAPDNWEGFRPLTSK